MLSRVRVVLNAPLNCHANVIRAHYGALAYPQVKITLATEAAVAAVAVVAGLAIGALSKNPALLGKAASGAVREGLHLTGRAFSAIAVADWSVRLGAPAVSTWNDKTKAEEAREQLGRNIGKGIVDFTTAWMHHSPISNTTSSTSKILLTAAWPSGECGYINRKNFIPSRPRAPESNIA